MSEYIKIKAIREDGEVFEYDNANWGLIKVEGLDFPQIEVFTSPKGFGHGDIITGQRKHARHIDIDVRSKQDLSNSLRNSVLSFHNSNYRYDLVIEYLGQIRTAPNCWLELASFPTLKKGVKPHVKVSFICPESDLLAEGEVLVDLTDNSPAWHVERHYTADEGLIFGEVLNSPQIDIYYEGSEPTHTVITIEAKGYLNWHSISVGDNVFNNQSLGVLNDKDILVLDPTKREIRLTRFEEETQVLLSGYSMTELLNLKLNYGKNAIRIDADESAYVCNVEYTGRYGGI